MQAVATLIVVMFVLTGCERKESPAPASTPAGEPWRARADELQAAIKPGMTQQEVLAQLGEPNEHKSILAGTAVQIWDYEIAPKIFFRVFFDAHDRVTSARVFSENTVGG
jgi:outer membrane protein assembly factor BamE (lipoprotein component of BamABCDE complex)